MRRPGRRRGISLVGVLLGVTVISFLILPLFLHFQTARAGAKRNANSLTAVTLATAQLEKLRRLSYRRLETILLTGASVEDVQDAEIEFPNVLSGPFEAVPEAPDLIEEGVLREGDLTYDRLTYLTYFPDPEPDPDSPDFRMLRRRMRIRVVIEWSEPLTPTRRTPRRFELSTMVHDEGYNPKPSLRPRELP